MIVASNNKDIGIMITYHITKMLSNPEDKVYSYLLFNIPIKIDVDESKESQIYTNGIGIVFEGNFKDLKKELTDFGVDNSLKHELMHIIFKHIVRGNEFANSYNEYSPQDIKEIFNTATDYIINTDLGIKNSNFITEDSLINLGLLKEDYENKSAEYIAEKIVEKLSKNKDKKDGKSGKQNGLLGSNFGSGFGNPDNHFEEKDIKEFTDFVKDNMNKGAITDEDIDAFINKIVMQGIMNYGSGKNMFFKQIESSFRKSLVDWKTLLINEIRTAKSNMPNDFGRKYVNRRFYQLEGLTPEIPMNYKKEKLDKVLVAIDSSGSIDDETYKKEIGQVINLLNFELGNYKVAVFDVGFSNDENGNKMIYENTDFSIGDIVKRISVRGYNGTDIKEVLDYCKDNGIKILVLISDMMFDYSKLEKSKYNSFRKIFISTNTDEYGKEYEEMARKLSDKFIIFKNDS
jgi:predicted metal-dependent peptidase